MIIPNRGCSFYTYKEVAASSDTSLDTGKPAQHATLPQTITFTLYVIVTTLLILLKVTLKLYPHTSLKILGIFCQTLIFWIS